MQSLPECTPEGCWYSRDAINPLDTLAKLQPKRRGDHHELGDIRQYHSNEEFGPIRAAPRNIATCSHSVESSLNSEAKNSLLSRSSMCWTLICFGLFVLLAWVPEVTAHGKYEWMMRYHTKTGADCCGIDDCGEIIAWNHKKSTITIQNESGRIWDLRHHVNSATFFDSEDGKQYACGTYSSYVPNYARCIWLPPVAQAEPSVHLAMQ